MARTSEGEKEKSKKKKREGDRGKKCLGQLKFGFAVPVRDGYHKVDGKLSLIIVVTISYSTGSSIPFPITYELFVHIGVSKGKMGVSE